MALLTTQDASEGAAITLQAAATGDQIAGGSRAGGWDLGVVLLVENTDAAAHDVTVEGNPLVSVPAGGFAVIPVYAGTYGMVRDITYSAVTGMSVAAVRISAGG